MKWLSAKRPNKFLSRKFLVEQLEDRTVPATLIDLTTAGAQATVNGAIISQDSSIGSGSGVFESFVRIQTNNLTERGYNTNARPVQFDENTSSTFTKAIQIGYVPRITYNGQNYRVFVLDINQNDSAPLLSLEQLRFYVGSSGSLNSYNTSTNQLSGLTAVWDLDRPTDYMVKLNANLSPGSGVADMVALIPEYAFAGASSTNYVYLYSRFGDTYNNNGGYEEWDYQKLSTPVAPPALATLGGTVFADTNNDGVKQAGESGIAGVTVRLTGINDLNAAVSITTTTSSTGTYSFTGLRHGTYTVTETQPSSYLDGKDTVGSAGGTLGNDVVSSISLTAGVNATGYNFGELVPSSLAGNVYSDIDNDGVKDAGESGIGGVTVSLTGTDDRGNAVSLSTTTSGGAYSFTNLRPGTYTLTEAQPSAYLDGKDTIGTPGGTTGGDQFSNISLAVGVSGANNNFGELAPASLSGVVFYDFDKDNAKDSNETGLATTVSLTGTDDRGNPVSLSTTSNATTGAFSFTNLRPGTYTVTETQPESMVSGTNTVGTLGGTLSGDTVSGITVSAGAAGTNYLFPETQAPINGFLQGISFLDANSNNAYDSGDTAMAGNTVKLYQNGSLVATTTTDANGYYLFDDLTPGTYQLVETPSATTISSGTQVLSTFNPASGSGNNAINVTVIDPNTITATFQSFSNYGSITYSYQGTSHNGSAGPLTMVLNGTGVANANTAFSSLCIDLGHDVSVGNSYAVRPELAPITPATSAYAGRIGYLYNHYVNASLDTTHRAALQVAVWELEYDSTPDLSAGTFQVSSTSSIISAANAYLAESVGKFEAVAFLNVKAYDPVAGRQGVLASASYNFAHATLIPGSIGGFVYTDADNDGVKDGGETGISGATVTLTGTNDLGTAVNVTATTSGTGAYSFTGLRPGTYTLTETQPTGYFDGKDTIGTPGGTAGNDVFSGIVIASGTSGANNNFGELLPASLAGFVYHDADNDGVKDAGESGIGGTTVTLTGTDDLGASVNVTATTDGTGAYSFTNLRPGTYRLTETQPSGYFDGKDTIGTPGGTTGSDQFSNIVLTSGVNGTNNNFGELVPASLAGFVYADTGNDGVKEAGEGGVGGATVALTGTDDLGTAVSLTATTDSTGAYSFGNLRPGTYVLTEAQPSGYLDGKDTIGTPGGTVGSDQFSGISLSSGVSGANNNFGELLPASLAGFVYHDSDNEGVKDTGESGIGGATVTLTGTDDLGASVNLTSTTNSSGAYSFTNLRPGTYILTETQPAGYLDGKDTVGTPGGSASTNDQISGITLNSGTNGTNNNFGELVPASLAGFVYADTDNDGVKDAGEGGVGGATVTLTGTDDLGSVSLTATTDSTGAFSFDNLRPGTYTLTEAQPAGYLDGQDTIGTPGGTAGNDVFSSIVIASGTSGANNNFGELLPASLTGVIFSDADNDGVKDAGESGIGGATVTLTGTNDLGSVTLTTTTDGTGAYTFGDLRPGIYTVTEAQPPPYLDGQDTLGSSGGTQGGDQFTSIVVPTGTSGTGYNFGDLAPSSVSGVIYVDFNNNGTQDAGEFGVGSATVTLTGTDDLGASVNLTTVTDGTGAYTFGDLRPGTYTVTETQPPPYIDGQDTLGSSGGTQGNDQVTDIVLTPGTGGTGYSFGNLPASSLSGFIYADLNENGTHDAGEVGVSGVTVTLTGTDDLGGSVTLTTTTDSTGVYTFPTLRPGTYTLTETQPTRAFDGQETLGTLGGTVGDDQFSDIVVGVGAWGSGYTFGESMPVSLQGFVYSDADNDGVKDAGESGISGVMITLSGTDVLGNSVYLTTTTDDDGAYAFLKLRPGTYTLSESQPDGWLDGRDTIGSQGGTAGNDEMDIVLGLNTDGTDNNFGELAPSSLSGGVYFDENNDGIHQEDEAGIADVLITLDGIDDLGNVVHLTTTTWGGGGYTFTNLRPGSYMITETPPDNYLDGLEHLGTQGGTLGEDVITEISLGAGVDGLRNNFGELLPAALSGYVYLDENNNGVRDGGEDPESGVSGVEITLTGIDDLGNSVYLVTTTAGDGSYVFFDLRPGTYRIMKTPPAGYNNGSATVGSLGGEASENEISNIVVDPGQEGDSYNFGLLDPGPEF